MNYALAKSLKDAGFPQREMDGVDNKVQKDYGFPTYVCIHGKCNYTCNCETEVYFPRLGELIEMCGKAFYALHKSEVWTASTNPELPGWIKCDFSTPESAVANLWLELNK